VISRQKLIGWLLIVFGGAYLAYFVRTRLFEPGPVVERKEWFNVLGCVMLVMIGTINVRMAAMRDRRRKEESSR
jgi:hypothetical protein